MNNKFYQKYKDLFSEDGRLPQIANKNNFRFEQQYFSPAADKSSKSKPSFNTPFQSHISNQSYIDKVNISHQSPVNIEFKNRIIPKLQQYDTQIDQKLKGKNQNIFSSINKNIFPKNNYEQRVMYKNQYEGKLNNPEDNRQYFSKRDKQKSLESANKKKVKFIQPDVIPDKRSFHQDYSSQYKNSFAPLSLSAVTQVNKDVYNYQFQRKKANRKFGKRVFRLKTYENQNKYTQVDQPQKNQFSFPKKNLNFQQKQLNHLSTQPSQHVYTSIKYSGLSAQKNFPQKHKESIFKTEPAYQQKKHKLKAKIQNQLVHQLEKLQQKYKERKKSGKFRQIALLKQQQTKTQQHRKFADEPRYQTQNGLSLLFSQYQNQYEFVGKRLSDIKNFQRFYPHLLINNYRQALMKRVQAKKKVQERQKKLRKLFDVEKIEYIRSKSPFEE